MFSIDFFLLLYSLFSVLVSLNSPNNQAVWVTLTNSVIIQPQMRATLFQKVRPDFSRLHGSYRIHKHFLNTS